MNLAVMELGLTAMRSGGKRVYWTLMLTGGRNAGAYSFGQWRTKAEARSVLSHVRHAMLFVMPNGDLYTKLADAIIAARRIYPDTVKYDTKTGSVG